MNQRPTLLKPVGPASLADEADFHLGDILVRPSLREVSAGDAREILEPRVMQVLVALAQAKGAVVSRDELIRQCWGGRIVGEDAINRCVAKIRQLAELGGGKAFEVETISRVGYRLLPTKAAVKVPQSIEPAIVQTVSATVAARPSSGFASGRVALVAASIAVTVAAVAGAIFLFARDTPSEWTVAESHRPFISTPLIERYPAIAPDGSMIAYSAGPTINNRHIYLRLLKGGDSIQLTHDAYDASAPAWSPDSSAIAYAIFQNGRPCRIMEIPVPAGESHQIGQCRFSRRSSLAFDASGHTLFFADAPASGALDRIVRLDLDNGQVSDVTHPGSAATSDSAPSISPDGKTLSYSRNFGGTRSQIRLLSLRERTERLFAEVDAGDASAAWSSDGRTIFIARSLPNDNALWAYPVSGGEPRPILSSVEYVGRISSGPDGLLAMEIGHTTEQLVALTPHSDLPPKPLDNSGLATWCVDYASDGTFLATGRRSDTFGVWISGANGAIRQLLPVPDGVACAIRWSPDGTRFAYIHWRPQGGFEVPVMTRGGETIARLHFSDKESGLLDWTADGKSILTSRQEKRGWRIWRTDLATPDRSVPVTPYGWLSPRVHGAMLFAEKDGVAGIWRIDETPPRRVTDGPAPDGSDLYTIAGDRLIYSDTTDPDHPMFSAQNINGGPKDRLAPLPGGQVNFTFGIDPKSGAIVYTRGTQDTDIGLLRLVKR